MCIVCPSQLCGSEPVNANLRRVLILWKKKRATCPKRTKRLSIRLRRRRNDSLLVADVNLFSQLTGDACTQSLLEFVAFISYRDEKVVLAQVKKWS